VIVASGVTYWQLPTEEATFFAYLARTGDVYAIPLMEAVPSPERIQARALGTCSGRRDSGRLYLTLREYALRPSLFEFRPAAPDEPVRYTLGAEFPSIMYTPGMIEDGQLSHSNASARTCFPDPTGKVFHKMPEPFLRWMRKVMSWLRRITPEWHEYRGYRVTRQAAQAALSGLILVPYHGWSGRSTGESSFMRRVKGATT
jgi:hypothetical protein